MAESDTAPRLFLAASPGGPRHLTLASDLARQLELLKEAEGDKRPLGDFIDDILRERIARGVIRRNTDDQDTN